MHISIWNLKPSVMTDSQFQEILGLHLNNQRIMAIKMIKEYTGMGLVEAKGVSDKILTHIQTHGGVDVKKRNFVMTILMHALTRIKKHLNKPKKEKPLRHLRLNFLEHPDFRTPATIYTLKRGMKNPYYIKDGFLHIHNYSLSTPKVCYNIDAIRCFDEYVE